MAIVKQRDPRTGTIYVYRAVSRYYPELKQSRSKRTLIGKLDEKTGEIVPCGKRGRPRKEPLPAETPEGNREDSRIREMLQDVMLQNRKNEARMEEMQEEIQKLRQENEQLKKVIDTLYSPEN